MWTKLLYAVFAFVSSIVLWVVVVEEKPWRWRKKWRNK